MHLIPDANKQIRELNQEIQKEQNAQRFMELVGELNRLLDGDGRTANETASPPETSPKSETADRRRDPAGKALSQGLSL